MKGAGNAGCWPHPRALRAKKGALCARKQRQGSRNNRHSLRNGFTAYTRSPRCTGLVGHRRPGIITQDLIPASGDQDRAISPYALARSSRTPRRPSHPASNVRDDREAPLLSEAGRAETTADLVFRKSEIFSEEGLNKRSQLNRLVKLVFARDRREGKVNNCFRLSIKFYRLG